MNANAIIEMCKTHLDSSVCQMIQDFAIAKYYQETKHGLNFGCACNAKYPQFRIDNWDAIDSINLNSLLDGIIDKCTKTYIERNFVYGCHRYDDMIYAINGTLSDSPYGDANCPCKLIKKIAHRVVVLGLDMRDCEYEYKYGQCCFGRIRGLRYDGICDVFIWRDTIGYKYAMNKHFKQAVFRCGKIGVECINIVNYDIDDIYDYKKALENAKLDYIDNVYDLDDLDDEDDNTDDDYGIEDDPNYDGDGIVDGDRIVDDGDDGDD